MGNWEKNNRSCTATWRTLKQLDQSDSNFADSEKKKMSELDFWVSAETPELRLIQAKAIAITMDNIFVITRGAKYENNSNRKKAIDDIENTLINSEKTISELAEINDSNYLFWAENKTT